MSFITAFPSLIRAQTIARGSAVTATFTTPATDIEDVPVIVGNGNTDLAFYGGGEGDTGTTEIQLLVSELGTYTPTKNDTVVLSTDGLTRNIVGSVRESHGIYTLTLGDASTQ